MIGRREVGAALALSLLLLSLPAMAADKMPKVGDTAPDFTVTTFDGQDLSLKSLRGKVILVNFWATWCGPCKRELPELDAYYAAASKFGLAMVAVNTEDGLDMSTLRPLAHIVRFPMARRFRGGGYKAPEAIPTNYIIDRAGVIRYAAAGAFDIKSLNDIILPLLKEPAPAVDAPTASAKPGL